MPNDTHPDVPGEPGGLSLDKARRLTQTETFQLLRSVVFFAAIPDDGLAEMTLIVDEAWVAGGDTILEKGDVGTTMYIVANGAVCVRDRDRVLNILTKGAIFGEIGALDLTPEARTASVTADVDTLLLSIRQQPLFALMAKHVWVAYGMIQMLCEHLRARVQDHADDYLYLQQFAKMTAAAAAVEAGVFEPETLDEVCARQDELGRLARVFQNMGREVQAREQRLHEQVHALQIEVDRVKQERSVAEITDTDLFRELKSKARTLRRRSSPGAS